MTTKASKSGWRKTLIALQQRFVLTREEKRVIAFVLFALLLGLTTKHYRNTHPQPPPSIDKKHSWKKYDTRASSSFSERTRDKN